MQTPSSLITQHTIATRVEITNLRLEIEIVSSRKTMKKLTKTISYNKYKNSEVYKMGAILDFVSPK